MMFRYRGGAGFLSVCCGEWVHLQSEGEWNEYIHLFLWLVQYWTRGKSPPFCCKDCVTFLNCRFILMSIFDWTLQSIPSWSSNMWQARHCRCFNHRVRNCWVFCAKFQRSAFSSRAITRKHFRPRHRGTGVGIGLWQWHRWCYWHKLRTVDWQHKLSTYCTFSPQVDRGSKWVITNGPTPHQ
jgi:hypothetical protein